MNRTDRLYALVEELRAGTNRARTARELGNKLEVTPRTIKRDISALQQAGVPIYSAPGPGGGFRLLGKDEAVLRPVTFTSNEAVAIAVALRTQPHLPFATDGAAALTKVVGAMTTGSVEAAERLAGRVWTTSDPIRSRAARTLDVAIAERRVVSIVYTGRDGRTSRRKVDPLQFAQTGGHWYLLAYCRESQGGRWFRLDRINRAHLTRQKADEHDVESVIGRPPSEARPVALNK